MIIKIKVSPKAKQTKFVGLLANGIIKIRIKEAPEDNKANKALIAFLAKTLNLQQKEVVILHGKTDTTKSILIPDGTILPW